MPTYDVLWEKGTKHDLKSLGRQAAEHVREAVETKLCTIPGRESSYRGTSTLLYGVIE